MIENTTLKREHSHKVVLEPEDLELAYLMSAPHIIRPNDL